MGAFNDVIALIYLASATCFVIGLHLMNAPPTANHGNRLSALGMAVAVGATLALIAHDGTISTTGWLILAVGGVLGSGLGLYLARTVEMTAMPQLVSLFNAVGGGAAALVAIADFVRLAGILHAPTIAARISVTSVLDVVIGAVTLSGSVVAAGKLQGFIPSEPIVIPSGRIVNLVLALALCAGTGYILSGANSDVTLIGIAIASLVMGVIMVLPIGGADMPVVISLLNAFTGTAVAMAGFVINSVGLIIAGALVGASGSILTKLMADAMNRSILNIVAGGFGTGDTASVIGAGASGQVRSVGADDVAIQLAYAQKVIIVPGYGLAAAHAQHAVKELADLLEKRGVEVSYAIHPVAGRMPGHMNVLLAEAEVPYQQLKTMEEINPEFPRADVALVIGANDVTNPAARRPGNAVSGMPILDVDKAKSIIVIKRSMGHGYAGIDNELYNDPKTGMFFADAQAGLRAIVAAVKTLVGVD
ncbi:MAG: NAD(P)(+) transhydrogenase (Re/Si-specific) subunit beta [Acidimicrobiales bacterium]|jgi:NAD(P) transhydrogenase subunit beta